MTLLVREATAADEAAVTGLWRACELTRPWNDPAADFRRAIDGPASTVLVGDNGGTLVGSAMVGFDGHRGWIYYLAVEPARRGKGHARQLLASCEDWLRQRGCPKVELMVREGNPAEGLYQRLGWEVQDVRVYARWLAAEA
jgi:ribosomal protein S18 acetylase RimI-like enzyme